jgi:hypothetical protein
VIGTMVFLLGMAAATFGATVAAEAVAKWVRFTFTSLLAIAAISYVGAWIGAFLGKGAASLVAPVDGDKALFRIFIGCILILTVLNLVDQGPSVVTVVGAVVSALVSIKAVDSALEM